MSTTEYRVVILLADGRRQALAETHTRREYAQAQADQMTGVHTEVQARNISPWGKV
ncbi:hypothetical protein [Nesterenkonia flava]|uniref:Uncharacterized protein n=1 Tax=Nesterenkonia flava TaxID=469799 RepID=A0ABU1FWG2_9MICC|nr:hypothetical protein [Nesterenkonia flava]MDR5712943.1 hypothetical protein [Nesterenkonia flava]